MPKKTPKSKSSSSSPVNITFHAATATAKVPNPTLTLSHALAHGLFTSASYFATQCRALEPHTRPKRSVGEVKRLRHHAYVLGAVTCSAMAMEAYINEFYQDALEPSSTMPGLTVPKRKSIKRFRASSKYYYARTIHKYKEALTILTGTGYTKADKSMCDEAQLLIDLRNFIAHYKSEKDSSLIEHAALEKKFAVLPNFQECSLYDAASLWFPHRCLGAFCAEWSVNTVERVASHFRGKTGYQRTLVRYRP